MEVQVCQWEKGEESSGWEVLVGEKEQNSLHTRMQLSKEYEIMKWNNVDECFQTALAEKNTQARLAAFILTS